MSRTRSFALTGIIALLASLLAAAPTVAQVPTTVLLEDFEDGTVSYTTATPEFSDGSGDFWARFGPGSTLGTGSFVTYTGVDGLGYYAGMDLDGEGASLPLTQDFGGLDITGASDLAFSVLVAEDDDGTNEDWDLSDFVHIDYQIDGAGFQPLIWFESIPDGDAFNAVPARDVDFDGDGDVGHEVTDTFSEFTAPIPATGSTLDLRITWNLDSGDEDLAIDNVTVSGSQAGTPAPTDPVINEFSFSTSSTDVEYLEVLGDPSTDYSAFTILEIEGDSGGEGEIVGTYPVGTTDASGYHLQNLPANTITNFPHTFTLQLVEDFTGAGTEDLDTDDDGTFDQTPWSRIVDSVAIDEGSGDTVYTPVVLTGDLAPADNTFVPGGGSRIPDGTDTDAVGDWLRNDFDLAGLPGETGTQEFGEALNTPGAVNEAVAAPVPQVVINEITQNPSAVSDSAGEWFEVTNLGSTDVDLDGWTISDNDTDSHVISGAVPVPAGGYVVLGTNADTSTNGGVAVDYAYSGIALANGADELVLTDAGGAEVDRVEWDGGPTFPDPNGASMALSDPTLDNNDGANWCEATTPYGDGDLGTPGTANDCEDDPGDDLSCDTPTTHEIGEIQGSGFASPLVGTSDVVVRGIVVGDHQGNGQGTDGDLGGFYLQDPDGDGTTDTSDGIFVFDLFASGPDVNPGDDVVVRGDVAEFEELTELTNVQVVVCGSGNDLPGPTAVTLPFDGDGDRERYEGMYVTLPETLSLTEYFELDRFGELVFTDGPPQVNPTQVHAPGSPDQQALEQANNDNRITLDDGFAGRRADQNPDPNPFLSPGEFFRRGATVTGVTGVFDQRGSLSDSQDFGFDYPNEYRVHRTQPVTIAPSPRTRPAGPPAVGGSLRVASFNVLNYFTTIDNGQDNCGPDANLECRGADSQTELDRQRDKIVNALVQLDADVVGLIEIQNDAGASADDLVAALNTAGTRTYDAIDTGFIGTDAIKVAFIYDTATVAPTGPFAILDNTVDPAYRDDRNRPALAQTFTEQATGASFTAMINHLKSKGSPCDDIGDPDAGDGQGNCNGTRTAAAQIMADWLATDPTGSGDADFLILGDLNAYAMEDPIATLQTAGYTDLVRQFDPGAYGYVFDGEEGTLDYGMANPALTPQVTGAVEYHINADELPILDYNLDFGRNPNFYMDNEFRASDHDPVLIGLDLHGPMCFGREATIIGTPGDDTLVGTNGPDVIVGLGGNDRIAAGNGHDIICGGEGDDQVAAGNGHDRVLGDAGNDLVRGGNGRDLLVGGSGDDDIRGGNGRDALAGQDGDDLLHGGRGNDIGDGGDGVDRCVDVERSRNCETTAGEARRS